MKLVYGLLNIVKTRARVTILESGVFIGLAGRKRSRYTCRSVRDARAYVRDTRAYPQIITLKAFAIHVSIHRVEF